MRAFSEFPTSAEPHQIYQLSRSLSPTSVFMLERSEEGKEQIPALKTERVASKEHLYTSSPDLQPKHTGSATGGQSCAMETCGTEPWGALVPRNPHLWYTGLPKRKPLPAHLVLIYDAEILRASISFCLKNYSVVCCWLSSADDSGVFGQHRQLLTSQPVLTQMVSQAWPSHPNPLGKYTWFGTILSPVFHRVWQNNYIQGASSG